MSAIASKAVFNPAQMPIEASPPTALARRYGAPTAATQLVMEYLGKNPLENEYTQRIVYDCLAKRTIENDVSSVVFLDIDGVMYQSTFVDVVHGTALSQQVAEKVRELFPTADRYNMLELDTAATYFFFDAAVRGLTRLIAKTQSVVVLSASLRTARSVPTLRKILSILPFCYAVIDRTPNFGYPECGFDDAAEERMKTLSYNQKTSEIFSWLQNHPAISKYVIFDDTDQDLSLFGRNFVKVDAKKLLTEEDLAKATAVLLE